MKTKTMKKVIAASVAAMMMCAPMMGINSAFAAHHNVKIENPADASRKYDAYQIFSGEVLNGKLAKIEWAKYDEANTNVNVTELLKSLNSSAVFGTGVFTTNMTAEQVATKLATYGDDSEEAIEFATLVRRNLVASASKEEVTGASTALDEGYYLLIDKTTGKDSLSRGLLAVVGDVSITEKVVVPSIIKRIVEDNNEKVANTAAIGDTVDYRLKSAVPDMTGYNKYYFIVNDTLDAGLTLNYDAASSTRTEETGFTVKLTKSGQSDVPLQDITNISGSTDNTPYNTTDAAYYVVQNTSTNTFKIVFTNFIKNQQYNGYNITIDYHATLNENATYGTTAAGTGDSSANKNTADLIYSNNPNVEYGEGKPSGTNDSNTPNDETKPRPDEPSDSTHQDPSDPSKNIPDEPTSDTPDSIVYTYTSKLVINKVDESSDALTGAGFAIYKGTKSGDTITYSDTALKEIKSTENTPISEFEFDGLDSGYYKIVETQVPAGYNKAEDIEFEIKSQINNTDVTWSKAGSDLISVSNSTYSGDIVNKSGITLPGTGGIGTTIFYISGGVLVLGAGVVLITKKRMSIKEDK